MRQEGKSKTRKDEGLIAKKRQRKAFPPMFIFETISNRSKFVLTDSINF